MTRQLGAAGGTLKEARPKAEGLLDLVVDRRASLLALERLFLIMGLAPAAGCLLLSLFRTGKTVGGGMAR